MRLIDADALMEEIAKHSYIVRQKDNSRDLGMTVYGIQQCVDEKPTAYDVDEKIKQLKAVKKDHKNTNTIFDLNKYVLLDDAINIVKGGAK